MSNNEQKNQNLDELENMSNAADDLEGFLSDSPSDDKPKPKANISMLKSIPVRLTLEVDSTEITIGDLLASEPGEVLPLDKRVGEPLDVRANGELFAKAEVVVVDGKYGMRLLEIIGGEAVSEAHSAS